MIVMSSLHSFEDFPLAYGQMLQQLDHCFWEKDRRYTILNSQSTFIKSEIPDIYALESNLLAAVLAKNDILVKGELKKYYECVKALHISRQLFYDSIKRILVLVHAMKRELFDVSETLALLADFETPEEVIALVESLALTDQTPSAHSQILLALTYIQEYYYEDLYLEDVAKRVHLSPGYLSRIFKPETGYSFKEYLHLTRIQRAQKLLLSTNLKYYEIAEKVGYKDYKYFSSYFNKISGCSAKEYKLNHIISNEKEDLKNERIKQVF